MRATCWVRAIALAALVALATVVAPTSAFAGVDPTPEPSQPGQAVFAHQVLERLLGARAANFHLVLDGSLHAAAKGPKHTKHETFVVSATGGNVTVRGPTGVALTAGAYWYLKHVTKCQVTWGVNGTGDQLALPAVLPDVAETSTSTIVPLRYAWNMCTFDYSAVWWDAARWTREIDWMALHGINLPLALIGQEHVWMIVFQQLGVTLEELESWFTGPAFLAWQRAGNVRKFAGPLTKQFIDAQRVLQIGILQQMRGLGMTPVLPCFSGHVPKATKRVFPNATITQSPGWNNFPYTESDVYVMDPTEPEFVELGKKFMRTSTQEFGTSGYYSCDTFNEVDPTSTRPSYLAAASKSVVDSIQDVDPEGVWVMQGWLFHFGYWTYDRVRSYLSGVPNDSMLILDLNSEAGALAPKFDQYFGKHWVWNMLHNYGGVRGVYGNLSRIATGPLEDLHVANSTMVGIGFTPEAIEQNPVMYEMLTSTFYAATPIEVVPWLKDYVQQRYGGTWNHTWETWHLLLEAVYSQPGEPRTELEHIPTWQQPDFGWKYGSPMLMTQAFETMVLAAAALGEEAAMANGPFQYDFVDVTRQASTMFFTDVHRVLVNQLTAAWYSQGTFNASTIKGSGDLLLGLISELDALLGTNPNYLLGKWTTDATNLAATKNESDTLMYNARNQVTLWGPTGQITDYAAKAWHNLYGDYYHTRWAMMIDSVTSQGPSHWNSYNFRYDLLQWEQKWCANTSALSPNATGKNSLPIAMRLLSNMTGDMSAFEAHANTVGGQPNGQYQPMWSTKVETLAKLCEIDPTCEGFDTNGFTRSNVFGLMPQQGTTFYAKKALKLNLDMPGSKKKKHN